MLLGAVTDAMGVISETFGRKLQAPTKYLGLTRNGNFTFFNLGLVFPIL